MTGKRAAWEFAMEKTLLELFEAARQDPKLRTRRGIKSQTWIIIAADLDRRCKSSFLVDQVKSKYARLLSDYELFVEARGEGTVSDDDWKKIIAKKPEYTSRFRQFKEHGCPHIEICRRIAALKVDTDDSSFVRKSRIERKARAKRSFHWKSEEPMAKKVCVEVDEETRGWDLLKEKMLLFLCWKAMNDRQDFAHEELETQGWTGLTAELNKLCTAEFDENEAKDKYVELMQHYNQFKLATGFSGVPGSAPKDEMDWERLIRERPGHYAELDRLKDAGGFPHVDVCSLVKGDTPPNGMGPATVSSFLATGALELPRSTQTPSQNQSSANAIASAQASLSANTLSYLLPATANIVTSLIPPATNGQQELAVIPTVSSAAGAPAVFSQELHDNLNMFLKTATAYLVMLINDHNQESQPQ